MKRVLFASLLWSSAALLAVEASYGIRKDHLQKTLGEGVYVDWTAGYISVSADHKIEDVRAGGGRGSKIQESLSFLGGFISVPAR